MRYRSQESFFGKTHQKRIRESSAIIIGLGGLGSCTAQLLCRAGIGNLYLYDDDKVGLTDLHRQLLYHEGDIGKSKALLAERKLRKMNSDVKIHAFAERVTAKTGFPDTDVIVDCTDSIKSRVAINRISIRLKTPLAMAAIDHDKAIIGIFLPGKGCFECIFGGKKDSPRKGIPGPLPVLAGAIQAQQVLNLLTGKAKPELIHIDLDGRCSKISFTKDKKCRC
jgi:molybdopterin/thiamine biosynthesis adenylyltransferase